MPVFPNEWGEGMSHPRIYAFSCTIDNYEHSRIVNATSSGKAKTWYFGYLREPCPDLKYTQVRCRKVGLPITTDEIAQIAEYRGVGFVRAGMRVQEGLNRMGTIVGAGGGGAYLEVAFDDGGHGYVHPLSGMRYYGSDGQLIWDSRSLPREASRGPFIEVKS